jgi:hypothetical protein
VQTTNTAQSTNRKALQTEGELSVYIAQARLIQKRKQEAELEKKRASTILNKRLSQIQKDLKVLERAKS